MLSPPSRQISASSAKILSNHEVHFHAAHFVFPQKLRATVKAIRLQRGQNTKSAAAENICGCAQSVEEPGLYSGADWVSNIYERKNSKTKRGQQVPPFPCGQLFQVHGNKLKLHPVRHLSQASVLRITHRVFFLIYRLCYHNRNKVYVKSAYSLRSHLKFSTRFPRENFSAAEN